MTDNIKCLKQVPSGQLFAYTDEMAQRADMVPYDGPSMTGQSQDVLASQRTLEENVAETDRKVEQMLRKTQGELDRANVASAQQREQYESENEAMRQRIAELEANQNGPAPAPVAEPAPAATLAPVPDNMQVVEGVGAETNGTAQEVPVTQESNMSEVPANMQVVDHTTQPVLVTDSSAVTEAQPAAEAAPVVAEPAATPAPAPATPPIAQPVAAPAQPVLPAAAQDVASALQ